MKINHVNLVKPAIAALIGASMLPMVAFAQSVEDIIEGSQDQGEITRRQLGDALIQYDQAARAKENEARAKEVYSAPPMLEDTLRAGDEVARGINSGQDAGKNAAIGALDKAMFPDEASLFQLEEELGEGTDVAGDTQQIIPFLKRHIGFYCSDMEKQAIVGCGDSQIPAGDITIESLLSRNTISADNDIEIRAAQDLIRNLVSADTNPIFEIKRNENGDIIPINFEEKTYREQDAIAQKYAARTVSSVAMHSLYQMYGMRVGNPELDGKSAMEVMHNEALRRFNSAAWAQEVGSTPPEGVIRELVQMEAFKIYLDYMRYRQNERLEALIAAMLANQTQLQLSIITSAQQNTSSGAVSGDE